MCCQLVTTFKMNFLVAIASYLFMSCVNINLNLLTNELDGIKKLTLYNRVHCVNTSAW